MAGPFCTFRLALLGADVIKVEPPSGDVFREYHGTDTSLGGDSAAFVGINSGKRSIVLDLKTEGGRDALNRLVTGADVVVENFRPGVADRLGVGPKQTRENDPALVHCSLSGYGQTGPLRDWPAYDHILQAVSGTMSLVGEEGDPPMKAGFPWIDTFAGFSAATAILTALYRREKTGEGDVIDVSMLDNALMLMCSMVLPYVMIDEGPRRVGNRGYNLSPTSDTFGCGEGFLAIGANTDAQYQKLCEVIGRPELSVDDRFATRSARLENTSELRAEIEAALSARSALAWEGNLNEAGVPAGAVRTIPEASDLEHVAERGVFDEIYSERYGRAYPLIGLATGFAHLRSQVDRPAPALGEHTRELLMEHGFTENEVRHLIDSGAAAGTSRG